MPKKKEKTYNEIDDIKKDINSLKSNVVELTKHLKENGAAQTAELKKLAGARLTSLQETGKEQLENVEAQVKEKPAQSLAIAFCAGLVTSYLLGRR